MLFYCYCRLFVSSTLDGDTEKNIDRFYVLMFSGTDENKSWYTEDNIKMYTESGQINASDLQFMESNRMFCKILKAFLFVIYCKSNFCDSI